MIAPTAIVAFASLDRNSGVHVVKQNRQTTCRKQPEDPRVGVWAAKAPAVTPPAARPVPGLRPLQSRRTRKMVT